MEIKTYTCPNYTLSMGICPDYREKEKVECIILLQPLMKDSFGVDTVHCIINTIMSLLFEQRGGANGTETSVEINLLNKRQDVPGNKSNSSIITEKDPYLFCYVEKQNITTSGDTGTFITLDVRFEFKIRQVPIGNARYRIYQSGYTLKP